MPSNPRALLQIAVLALVWGCNWPVLKMGVGELAPLTFRALTLPFAALGLLAVARFSGDAVRIAREHWGKVAVLALLNIAGWNGLVLFGVQLLPAGRSAIIAYTMPLWATIIATLVLNEPLSKRKAAGLGLGMVGMALLLGEEVRAIERAPFGALMILGAAVVWACGTVLLRKWKPPIPQNTLTGWMMLRRVAADRADGAVPRPGAARDDAGDDLAARLVRDLLQHRDGRHARALGLVHAGADAAGRGVVDRRRCRCRWSACSPACCCSASGPGPNEWLALGFVVAGLVAVLWTPPKPHAQAR